MPGRLVSFIFRGDEVVAEESQEDRIRYIRTSVLLASDAESARTYYHYASDEMSSVTHVVDSENEEILNRYEYDAWGNLTTCEEKVHNRFKFNGQQYDPISQQYYLRARYYNPVIGRFTQEDSYNVDGLNLYAYCRNNPVYYVDPSGNICETAANRIMDKFTPDGQSSADRKEQKKLASYLRNKQNHGGVLTPSEQRILGQIDDYTAAGKSGKPSPSHYISENGPGYVYMASYDDMRKNPYIHGQKHHTNQGAAYNSVILYPDGLCVELYGNAFIEKNSWHYKAHQSLETFWDDYRGKEGASPTNGQYLRALYDSMVFAGFSDDKAAYIESRAYAHQKSYGLEITEPVPNVPNPMHQQ